MKFIIRLFLLVLLVAAGAGYVFYRQSAAEQDQTDYMTETVKQGHIHQKVLATGSVRASQRIEVGAQVSGKIQKIYVALGQAVKQGELLAEIDSSNQRNSLASAEAQLATYRTQLTARQVTLEVATSHYQRLSKLVAQKSVSQDEWETAKNNVALAKANVEESQSQIKVAEIAVNNAKVNLAYTQIRSPIDGVVVSIPVAEGQTANANQTSPTLVQVADLTKVLIKLEIAEGDIALVQPHQTVSFTTLAEPNRPYHGEILSLDPALTTLTDNSYQEKSGNSEAVYYYANVLIDNPDHRLRIGMTAQAEITIAEKKAVLILPNSAIKKRGKQSIVQVLAQGKVIEKKVEIGLTDSLNSEVISGLSEGEQVITAQRPRQEKSTGSMRMPRF